MHLRGVGEFEEMVRSQDYKADASPNCPPRPPQRGLGQRVAAQLPWATSRRASASARGVCPVAADGEING
jgi:hypothetical protein